MGLNLEKESVEVLQGASSTPLCSAHPGNSGSELVPHTIEI